MILLNTSINHRVVGQSYPAEQLLPFGKYLSVTELCTSSLVTCWDYLLKGKKKFLLVGTGNTFDFFCCVGLS